MRSDRHDLDFELVRRAMDGFGASAAVIEEVHGRPLEILRYSMPYGTTAERGLYFIAYGARAEPFERMLETMIVADGQGHYDHLMDFSRAVTGASFFVPARDWLEAGAP